MNADLIGKLIFYGVAAFDPIGVAAVLLLLTQQRGITRAWVFLAGSITALMLMGVAIAQGFGRPLVEFTRRFPWLDPTIEFVAGVVLLAMAVWLFLRSRKAGSSLTPESMAKRLSLPLVTLFVFGFVLVVIQSIVDVVFLLAMVETGARELGVLKVILAVAIYTFAALFFQVIVVVVYQLLAPQRRAAALAKLNDALEVRGEFIAAILAAILGSVLVLTNLGTMVDLLT